MNLLNNRYRVIRELGDGGFGKTYLAEDTQMPSLRCCVIKQLKSVNSNPEVYQLIQDRFAREAAFLERLGDNSPQIPRLYAYFTEDNQFYLVQEWIEGITLTKQVQQFGHLSESSVREILKILLSVLDYVHTQGIVHRDIKPDNIILRASDGQPVLIDFGAVREIVTTELNSQGHGIITLGFMPPEQGAGRPVYSSDLYSLGLTAIYLLTGKKPQELLTDPTTAEIGQIVWQKQGVSPILADVLDRAIRFHPRDRFPTAKDMLEALQTKNVLYSQTKPPSSPPQVPPPAPPYSPVVQPSPLPSYPTPAHGFKNAEATPPNRSNAAIVGGLIGGGLLAGGVVMAIALRPPAPTNSSNQSVVVNPSPQTVSASNSPVATTPIVVNPPASVPVSSPPRVIVNSPPRNNLASEAGVSYSNLENLLASGRWQSADRETTRLMVAIANPAKSTYIDGYSVRRIPCTDLNTIDRLWRNYSNNKFGFSIQKSIWNQVGGNKAEFDRYIGWRIGDRKIKYEGISFNSQAPTGHLPYIRVLKHEEFFSRDRCF